jgi:hypothetical protein
MFLFRPDQHPGLLADQAAGRPEHRIRHATDPEHVPDGGANFRLVGAKFFNFIFNFILVF